MAVGLPALRLLAASAAFGLLPITSPLAQQGSPLQGHEPHGASAAPLHAAESYIAPLAPLRTIVIGDSVFAVYGIRFQGNRAFSDKELKAVIETRTTRCKSFLLTPFCLVSDGNFFEQKHYLDRIDLALDINRIRIHYFLRGYRSAAVDTVVRRVGDKARIIFVVDEGEPLRMTSFGVNLPPGVLDRRRIDEAVQVSAGQPYDVLKIDTSMVLLREALWDRGYSDAIVTLDTAFVPEGVNVAINVNPRWISRVSEVQISGNFKIGERTIRNSLTLRPGDRFRLSELARSQRVLYESGLFSRAIVDVFSINNDSLKIINVQVTEAKLREARIGGGVSTVDFFQVDAHVANLNWLGGAKRASVNATVGNLLAKQLNGKAIFRDALEGIVTEGAEFLSPTWRASAELKIPWFRSPLNTISLSGFVQRRSLPGIFVDRSYGSNAIFTREIRERIPISFGYQYEVTRVEAGDLYFCVNFGLCDPPTIAAVRSSRRMSPLSVSTNIERADNPIDATRGFNARASIEHASTYTMSDYRYNRAFADASWYFPIRGRRVLALRVRGGWVGALGSTEEALGVDAEGRSILHPRKRFFAGGSQSVRGFGEGQLGPRILTIPRERLEEAGCTVAPGNAVCDADILNDRLNLPDSAFTARPLGGNLLAETSVEFRFPLYKTFEGALFVDAALVGERGLSDLRQSTMAVTPGFGIRYKSVAGPIRVDLGYNPFLTEDLPVVTEVAETGRNRITTLQMTRASDNTLVPARRTFAPTRERGVFGFLSQFTLHLSIGQAF